MNFNGDIRPMGSVKPSGFTANRSTALGLILILHHNIGYNSISKLIYCSLLIFSHQFSFLLNPLTPSIVVIVFRGRWHFPAFIDIFFLNLI
jgi:hypothetical protein